MVIPDSICYPQHAESTYPYNPDGTREFLEDKPFLEPFSLIPALGAVTSQIRFTTFVVKLPIRHPLLLAKQVTSTAVLTGGRLVLGVGTSPWREDYDDARRGVGEPRAADGRVDRHLARAGRRRLLRVPRQDLRPAVGQDRARCPPSRSPCSSAATPTPRCAGPPGWGTAGCTAGETPRTCLGCWPASAELRRTSRSREASPFEVHVISTDAYTVDGVRRLEELGVTDVIVGFRWPYATGPDTEPLDRKLDNLRRFADTVIAKA